MDPAAATHDYLRGMNERGAELRARAERMQAELAEIVEDVRSRDDLVTVTVGAGGIMRGLVVSHAGARGEPARLSRSIMSAYAEGCRRVGERAAAVVARDAPTSPAVAMMRDAVPPPSPEFEEDAR
ncbi:MAG: YbaB/EbfC family nucleoid-associated protein [Jatrophihabitans sp.]